jgi:hypothetical protein
MGLLYLSLDIKYILAYRVITVLGNFA